MLLLVARVAYIGNRQVQFIDEGYLPTNNQTQEQEVAERASYTILIGGDVMLARKVGEQIVSAGFDPFVDLKPLFAQSDLVIVNLESIISDIGTALPWKLYAFRAPVQAMDTLVQAGVHAVSIANNHAADYGTPAFLDTLNRLEQAGIGVFGGGVNAAQAYAPLYITLDKLRVAFVGLNIIEIPFFKAGQESPGIAWFDEQLVSAAITEAKGSADYVIVLPHWGWEYTAQVNDEQKRIGRLLIDYGADFVVGGHPHHVQEIEEYKGKFIHYSLGNMVFDGPGPAGWNDGELIRITLTTQGELVQYETIPIYVDDSGLVEVRSR